MDTTFIDELSSAAPTPGGGGASAYVGALASALASMVGNLTVGKKAYAQVEADVYVTLEKLADVRERLLELVDDDARAFEPLAAAYRMPKATPEEQDAKHAALQVALVAACDVPLEIMRQTAKVVELSEFLAYHGSKMALSDVGVAVAFARAAVEGASLNIFINAASMDDVTQAERYRDEARAVIKATTASCNELYAHVMREIA